jgi:hypothetical protein
MFECSSSGVDKRYLPALADPLYQDAVAMAWDRTIMCDETRMSNCPLLRPLVVGGGCEDATLSSCMRATEVVEGLRIRRGGLSSEQIWTYHLFRAFAGNGGRQ